MSALVPELIIAELSDIVFQGIRSILSETGRKYRIHRAFDLNEVQQQIAQHNPDIVMLNPSWVQTDLKSYQNLRNEYPGVKWAGIIYSFFDPQLRESFDSIINISDLPHMIIKNLDELQLKPVQSETAAGAELLSDREMDVLKLLVGGLANKEIADKLNISVHTVITHRKNIAVKTGIKSVSGLTIYAVVKGIISIPQ